MRDNWSKEERVKFLYPNLSSFDYAIPIDWVKMVASTLNLEQSQVINSFIWGYRMYNREMNQPLPLTLESADWLVTLNEGA